MLLGLTWNQNFAMFKNVHIFSASANPIIVETSTLQQLSHEQRAEALCAKSATIETFQLLLMLSCVDHLHVKIDDLL